MSARRALLIALLVIGLMGRGAAQEIRLTGLDPNGSLHWSQPAQDASVVVELTTNIISGPWLPAMSLQATNGSCATQLPGPMPPKGFYRVRVSPTNEPPGMGAVASGAFLMGDSYDEGFANARPAHVVRLDRFYIDRFEVSNEQMRDALQWAYDRGLVGTDTTTVVNTEGDSRELLDLDGDDHGVPFTDISFSNGLFRVADGREQHPASGVTWYGAQAYCNYRSDMQGLSRCITFTNRLSAYISNWPCDFTASGYRLPTEAEWEKAARGGMTGHHFPWASYGGSSSLHLNHDMAHYGGSNTTMPVGSYMPNGYGLHDMAGNVWEWTYDYYKGDWYSQAAATEDDTRGPDGPYTGTEWLMTRVIRGGSVGYNNAVYLTCACRHSKGYSPGYANWVVGFRCACKLAE